MRYALLPLRIFLGVTFAYAGLDKLSDPAFLGTGPGSMLANLNAAESTAAIPAVIDLALRNPEAFGLAIASGELAVGVGTLVGFWSRLAALGGALISLSLWLTVSWQVHPYYLGNDLPYLMAWLPLVLAGVPVFSVDAAIAGRKRRRQSMGATSGQVRRRALLDTSIAAVVVGGVGGALGGVTYWRTRNKQAPADATQQPAPAPSVGETSGAAGGTGGGPTVAVAEVPVGKGVKVQREDGKPAFVVQPQPDRFTAFSAICTHSGCEVSPPKNGKFHCPCHNSEFDAATGEVLQGPATQPLQRFGVRRVGDQLEIR